MTASGWRPGDLGRSKVASEVRPQFEAISAGKDGVVLWHHMRSEPDVVPVATFRRDYTPDWKLATAVPLHRVHSGLVYSMDSELPCTRDTMMTYGRGQDVTIRLNPLTREGAPNPNILVTRGFQTPDQTDWERKTGLHIRGRRLKIRRVQHNFVSCDVLGDLPSLVIIPVEWVERWGCIYNSLWDHLESDWSL